MLPDSRVLGTPTVEDFRLAMLKSAGLDPEVAGVELRKAIDKTTSLLHVTKTQFFSDKGIVVDQRTVEDTAAQLRAAEILISTFTDMYPARKNENVGEGNVTVIVNGWIDEGVTKIDVTS